MSNVAVSASRSRRVRLLTDEQRAARRVYARQRRAQQPSEMKEAERVRRRQRRAVMTDEQKEAERQRRRHHDRDRRKHRHERRSRHYQSALLRTDGTCNPVDCPLHRQAVRALSV